MIEPRLYGTSHDLIVTSSLIRFTGPQSFILVSVAVLKRDEDVVPLGQRTLAFLHLVSHFERVY